jgi:hypothetical protein
MNTASFTGFLNTLIWIVLFYYAFKFLFRLLAPFLVKFAVQKAEKSFNDRAKQFYDQQTQYSDSSQTYKNKSSHKSEININDLREKNKVGEYIDFEEVN